MKSPALSIGSPLGQKLMSAHLSPSEDEPPRKDSRGFEAALRRDLSRAPLLAYETCVGGIGKRMFDLGVAVFFLPAWALALIVASVWIVARGARPVFHVRTCIGYGGRSFRCVELNLMPPTASRTCAVVDLADAARMKAARLRAIVVRLPQMLAVLRGDMSLVGPSPITRAELDRLRSARRAYLSARPGLIGLEVGGDGKTASEYKAYQNSWSLGRDVAAIFSAVLGLRNRLWQPADR